MKENVFKDFRYGIFDVDGTLLNSIPVYLKQWGRFWKKFGVPEKISTKLWNLLFRMDKLDHFLNNAAGEYIKHLAWKIVGINDNESVPFSGARELLERLIQYGITLFVSSGSFTAKKRLERTDMDKYFSLILEGKDGCKTQHIRKITEYISLPFYLFFTPGSFYVADTPKDMEVAKKYGIYAIGIANRYSKQALLEAGADEVVEKIGDLLD